MPAKRLKAYLDERDVTYKVIEHPVAYTAQEIAAAAHIRGEELAKTVVVRLDGALALVVLPATELVELEEMRAFTGADTAQIVPEHEFRSRFRDCELGAMPPFGNLYHMEVFVAGTLSDREEITFNAGTHAEAIQMAYRDFARLVRPHVVRAAAVR
jgi:Ala-tRNA(Pro) deacylase